jgi:hypothetical protein
VTPEQLAALAREAVYAWDPDTDPARPDGTTSHAELVARAQDTGSSVLSLQRQPAPGRRLR